MNFNPTDPSGTGASFAWLQQLDSALRGEHPALRHGNVPLEIHLEALPGKRVAVVGLSGKEALNEPYEYAVEVVTPFPPEVFQPAVFGLSASLLLRTPERDGRVIQGIVSTLSMEGVAERGLGKGLFRYVVTIVPRLWLWSQRRRNRVFQNKSLPELVKQLFKADGIDCELRLVERQYPKRPLYYQREETDLEFLQRVLAESGVFFFFEHAVQDSSTRGVLSAVGAGAGMVGAAGGAVSAFGAKAVGGALSGAASGVGDATRSRTQLVLAEEADGVSALQDFAALNELANRGIKLGRKALSGLTDPLTKWAGKGASTAVGMDVADKLVMDRNDSAAIDEERVYSFGFRRQIRPKSVWSVERNERKPAVWAHRESEDRVLTPKLNLDLHLWIGRGGLQVDNSGVSMDLQSDAPMLDPSELEQEWPSQSARWLQYPSESQPQEVKEHGTTRQEVEHDHLSRPLEQLRWDSTLIDATTDCRRLAAGYRFSLTNHPIDSMNSDYSAIRLSVVAVDPDMAGLDAMDPQRERPYNASVVCVPGSVTPRPPLPRKRKLAMELGTVVRWEGSTDMVEQPRNEVLVRLGWDVDEDGRERPNPRENDDKERDSVLTVPILQPWAGAGYGLQAVPRNGMQVVVGYLDNQGDRPVILGCLHSDAAPPPWTGAETLKVGFKTQSRWPRGTWEDRADGLTTGWSEISIDDTGSHELVRLRAARDMATEVSQDHSLRIGANANTFVQGDSKTNIVGQVDIKAQDDVAVSLRSDAQVDIGGGLQQTVEGALRLNVSGAFSEQVTGDRSSSVSGTSSQDYVGPYTSKFGDDCVAEHAGHLTTIVGAPKAERSVALHVNGDVRGFATELVELEASKGLTIRCGNSYVLIRSDSVTIQSPLITLQGKTIQATATDTLTLSGEKISAKSSDALTLTGKKAFLSSESASVALDSNATIQGATVKLAKGDGAQAAVDKAKKAPKLTTLVLADRQGNPIGMQRAALRRGGEGGDERHIVLDDAGTFALADPGALEVWFPDFPAARPWGSPPPQASGKFEPHVLRPFETVPLLASRYGFAIDDVWQLEQNKALREKRLDPRMLRPGDVFWVPTVARQYMAVEEERENRFVAPIVRIGVQVRLLSHDKPRANERFIATGGGAPQRGKTDADGIARFSAPASAHAMRIELPARNEHFNIALASVPPVTEIDGLIARLRNVGHAWAGRLFSRRHIGRAVASYQATNGLQVTGVLDTATEESLAKAHHDER